MTGQLSSKSLEILWQMRRLPFILDSTCVKLSSLDLQNWKGTLTSVLLLQEEADGNQKMAWNARKACHAVHPLHPDWSLISYSVKQVGFPTGNLS